MRSFIFITLLSVVLSRQIYPVIMWEANSVSQTEEIPRPIKAPEVFQYFKGQDNVFLFIKEDLTTQKLTTQASTMTYLKDQVFSSSRIFRNLKDSVDFELVNRTLDFVHYEISDMSDLHIVKQLLTQEQGFSKIVFTVSNQIDLVQFDQVISELDSVL